MISRRNAYFACLLLVILSMAVLANGSSLEDEYDFHRIHRVNAHGDEFMSLAMTGDGQKLVIGTEKGELIVWGIREGRILRQLQQGSPIHCVVALNDLNSVLAAGGPHSEPKRFGIVRRWNVDTGESQEWSVPSDGSIIALTTDPSRGLVAAANISGRLFVWDSKTAQLIANQVVGQSVHGLALIDRLLYLTTLNADDEKRMDMEDGFVATNSILTIDIDHLNEKPRKLLSEKPEKLWGELNPSTDGRLIAAACFAGWKHRVSLVAANTGNEIATFEHQRARWDTAGRLLLFDDESPSELATIDSQGEVTKSALLTQAKFHGSGTPSNMTEAVVSADGKTVWETFQMGAALAEINLATKTGEYIYNIRTLVYAGQLSEDSIDGGLLATGGDDGFVRVWRLSDLSLIKEFHVDRGVPQGVALTNEGRYVIFSYGDKDPPTEISVGDLKSGVVKHLLKVPQPFAKVVNASGGFIYEKGRNLLLADPLTGRTVREFSVTSTPSGFAVSPNGEWLAIADKPGYLQCFEVKTGRRIAVSAEKIEDLSTIAVSSDGRYVYTTEWKAALRRWDTRDNKVEEIGYVRGQAHSLFLSSDGNRLALGGNHRDVAVYDAHSGDRLGYFRADASDFYVTNAWIIKNRLLFTTDGGVLFDGRLGP